MKHLKPNQSQTFKRMYQLFFCLLIGVSIAACSSTNYGDDDNNEPDPPASTPADIEVTIDNVGASGWQVKAVTGDDNAAEKDKDNVRITLEENKRYRFVNNGGSGHPLGLQDADGEYLLSQDSISGSFEGDADVDFKSDNQGITFTLTPALASQLATYNCTIHASMEGSIEIR